MNAKGAHKMIYKFNDVTKRELFVAYLNSLKIEHKNAEEGTEGFNANYRFNIELVNATDEQLKQVMKMYDYLRST